MIKITPILTLVFIAFLMTSCVESSKKYKNLQAQLDSQ